FAAALVVEVQRDAAFVARIQNPAVIFVGDGHARNRRQVSIWIAEGRPFDLDHVGSEIGEDGRGRRSGYVGGAVDHAQPGKNALLHGSWASQHRGAGGVKLARQSLTLAAALVVDIHVFDKTTMERLVEHFLVQLHWQPGEVDDVDGVRDHV